MASELGWRAIIRARGATWQQLQRSISDGGAFDSNPSRPVPLRDSRRQRRGVRAMAWRLAPSTAGHPSLGAVALVPARGTGRAVEAGVPGVTFGSTSAKFYERFELARLGGMLSQRLDLRREETDHEQRRYGAGDLRGLRPWRHPGRSSEHMADDVEFDSWPDNHAQNAGVPWFKNRRMAPPSRRLLRLDRRLAGARVLPSGRS